MFNLPTVVPKPDGTFLEEPREKPAEDPRQRRSMMASLAVLLLALGIVLWHDRDFWLPDVPETESQQTTPPSSIAQPAYAGSSAAEAKPAPLAKSRHKGHQKVERQIAKAAETDPSSTAPLPPAITATRTVLPPLAVEVVAGDTHRMIRPGSSSVRVDLQEGTPPRPATDDNIANDTAPAASLTVNAAEKVRVSSGASAIVASPVKPAYPLLARQMKVQGAVILQALISKDGIIQDLRVVSGPNILASAAEAAVRRWRFKPHFEGSEPVETQAKITVNFTISTN